MSDKKDKRPSMNIWAGPGDVVEFAFPEAGYQSDIERGDLYLKVGEHYAIARVEVHSCSTDVWLANFPNVSFNSVQFADVTIDEDKALKRCRKWHGDDDDLDKEDPHRVDVLEAGVINKKREKAFGVYHTDTNEGVTVFLNDFDTFIEAQNYMVKRFAGAIRTNGANHVEILDQSGKVHQRIKVG